MSIKDLIFELIDMRSFSNLWYWIALAVFWSSSSRWVMGVPHDLIVRAKRGNDHARRDLAMLAEAHVNRILYLYRTSGLILSAFAAFVLTGMAMLAWIYWVEIAQAVFLIAAPGTILGMMTLNLALQLERTTPGIEELTRRLEIHRIKTQALGMVSIFVTSVFGMYQNINIGAIG